VHKLTRLWFFFFCREQCAFDKGVETRFRVLVIGCRRLDVMGAIIGVEKIVSDTTVEGNPMRRQAVSENSPQQPAGRSPHEMKMQPAVKRRSDDSGLTNTVKPLAGHLFERGMKGAMPCSRYGTVLAHDDGVHRPRADRKSPAQCATDCRSRSSASHIHAAQVPASARRHWRPAAMVA